MATPFVLTSATVGISATWTGTAPGLPGTQTISGTLASSSDLTVFTTTVGVNLAAAPQDSTNFGSGGYTSVLGGLKSGTIALTLNQDFSASQLHTIINTIGLGATAYLDLKATSAARSATNPSYAVAVIITEYHPVMGQVGGLAQLSVTWPTTGAFAVLTS